MTFEKYTFLFFILKNIFLFTHLLVMLRTSRDVRFGLKTILVIRNIRTELNTGSVIF